MENFTDYNYVRILCTCKDDDASWQQELDLNGVNLEYAVLLIASLLKNAALKNEENVSKLKELADIFSKVMLSENKQEQTKEVTLNE